MKPQQGQPCAEKQFDLLSGRQHSCYLGSGYPTVHSIWKGFASRDQWAKSGDIFLLSQVVQKVLWLPEGRTRVPLTSFEAWDSFYCAKLPSRHITDPEMEKV